MQTVRGDRAVDKVMRCARPLRSRLTIWVVQGAHDAVLEPGRPLIGPNGRTGFEAPRRVGQGFRCGGERAERACALAPA